MDAFITLGLFLVFCIVIIAIGFLHFVIRGWDIFSHEYRQETERLRAGKSARSTTPIDPATIRRMRELSKPKQPKYDRDRSTLIKPIGVAPIRIYDAGERKVHEHLAVTLQFDQKKNLYISDAFVSLDDIDQTKTRNVYKVRSSTGELISLSIQQLKTQVFDNEFFQEDIRELQNLENELNHYNKYKNCIKKVEKEYWFTLLEVDDAPPINTLTAGMTFPAVDNSVETGA